MMLGWYLVVSAVVQATVVAQYTPDAGDNPSTPDSYTSDDSYPPTTNTPSLSGYTPSPSGYTPSPSGYNPSPSGYNPSPSGYNPSPSGYNPAPTASSRPPTTTQSSYNPPSGRNPSYPAPRPSYTPSPSNYPPSGRNNPPAQYTPSDSYGNSQPAGSYYNSDPAGFAPFNSALNNVEGAKNVGSQLADLEADVDIRENADAFFRLTLSGIQRDVSLASDFREYLNNQLIPYILKNLDTQDQRIAYVRSQLQRIVNITNRIEQLNETIARLEFNLRELNASRSNINREITFLQSVDNGQDLEITTLEAQISGNSGRVAELRRQRAANDAKIQELTNNIRTVEAIYQYGTTQALSVEVAPGRPVSFTWEDPFLLDPQVAYGIIGIDHTRNSNASSYGRQYGNNNGRQYGNNNAYAGNGYANAQRDNIGDDVISAYVVVTYDRTGGTVTLVDNSTNWETGNATVRLIAFGRENSIIRYNETASYYAHPAPNRRLIG